jgi:uncharacterized protein GlcG (DUF336 family)
MSITLHAARSIIPGARAHAATAGFKPLSMVVLDAGGDLLAAEREDGSSNKRFEIAHGRRTAPSRWGWARARAR